MQDFEKLGLFYLGRPRGANGALLDAPRVASANDRIRRAEERVRRETAQYEEQRSQSMISVGATLLGAP